MGSKKLPILARPYGGPHGARVVKGATTFNEDQWYADQGFVVVIADGRGTPARGPVWERSIYQDFVNPILQDQVDAVLDVAEHFPDDVDAQKVAIMGWSFGGYLAGLAVLERPDVFHVAIAGAPVTEWLWYDTAYTERYLGHPDQSVGVYEHNSLMSRAAHLSRPLMLVHGLIDDNVVIAHSLELSKALLEEARDHTVLPLSGVTHMPHQPKIAENVMLMTVSFIKNNL
jgi:dipeptidyl-peptidase-4